MAGAEPTCRGRKLTAVGVDASLSIVGHFHIRNLTVEAWFAGSAATLLSYRGLWARPEIACVPTPSVSPVQVGRHAGLRENQRWTMPFRDSSYFSFRIGMVAGSNPAGGTRNK